MNWRFTLINRNNISYIIEEPVGWDAFEISVKRDLDTHGIFFDYQNNDFQFPDVAMRLIKAEYEQYGVEGQMVLVIEEACEGNELEELYRGRLLFSRYEFLQGDECYVKISLETTSDVMQLRNRWDQKVDLQTNIAFDGTTALPAYPKLGFALQLKSKGIPLSDSAINAKVNATPVVGTDRYTPSTDGTILATGMIEIGMDTTKSSEIGGFYFQPQPLYQEVNSTGFQTAPNSPYDGAIVLPDPESNDSFYTWVNYNLISPNVNYAPSLPNYNSILDAINFQTRVKGKIKALNGSKLHMIVFCVLRVPKDGSYQWLSIQEIKTTGPLSNTGEEFAFDKTYADPAFILNRDDRIYSFLTIVHQKPVVEMQAGMDAFSVQFDEETFFRMETISKTASSDTKAFMVNEAISRVAEAITDNKIKAYSEYFGRTDSQPYSVVKDGCGSLEAITNGLFIRRQESRTAVQLNLSMKDIWDGLDPIHHIGFGIEDDVQLPGSKRLRVEPWNFFYKNDIVLYLPDVAEVKTKVIENEHFSTFTFGYEKWEAEEYTGLDEFLTKRQYRTTLSQVKNDLPKLSKFIASGYALEVTRRKGDIDSKDWRYDNNNFIVCLRRNTELTVSAIVGNTTGGLLTFLTLTKIPEWAKIGAVLHIVMTDNDGNPVPANTGDYTIATAAIVSGFLQIGFTTAFATTLLLGIITISNINFLEVELGNVSNPQNIIDPATIYNYRISPIRNAMRWMNKILASYRQINATNQIIFTDGDGNYIAAGEMTSASCKFENSVLAENASLGAGNFIDASKAAPILRPERLVLDYPMSVRDFKKLFVNPYGLIALSNEQQTWFAYVDEIKYKPEDGIASHLLIPLFTITNNLLNQLTQFITDNP